MDSFVRMQEPDSQRTIENTGACTVIQKENKNTGKKEL